jgi:hypothetical protein
MAMITQPAILTYQGQPAPSADELDACWRMAINATGLVASIIGKDVPVSKPIHIHDEVSAWVHDAELSALFAGQRSTRQTFRQPMVWWDVWRSLRQEGHDPSAALWLVALAGTLPTDGTGVGMPVDNAGRVQWDATANPRAGGIAVLGRRGLETYAGHNADLWTDEERIRMKIDARIWAHEWGHMAGRHHTRRDPVRYRTESIMGYAYREWIAGDGTGWDPRVGGRSPMNPQMATPQEIATWRAHVATRERAESTWGGARIWQSVTVEQVIAGKYPMAEGLLYGWTAEEWMAHFT